MSVSELTNVMTQLRHILCDHEARGREPRRVLEMIACLVREFTEVHGTLPGAVEQILLSVDVWERGERPDLNALETIAAMARQCGSVLKLTLYRRQTITHLNPLLVLRSCHHDLEHPRVPGCRYR